MDAAKKSLSIVIPVFNEEKGIEMLLSRLFQAMQGIRYDYEVIFVNDGSTDGTLEALVSARAKDGRIKIVNLSRNFGHQNALTAGIDQAGGDGIVLMDADLEDDPVYIAEFVRLWEKGHDVVYAKRVKRKASWLKKAFFRMFHRINFIISDIKIDATGIFCLMDNKVVKYLKKLPERDRYIPGLRGWIGFRQIGVEVPRGGRYDGRPRVQVRHLFKLAFDSFTSFSSVPLKIAMFAGIVFSMISFFCIALIIVMRIFMNLAVQGWASTISVILLVGGIQLICIGLQGEYISRIFNEVKDRPNYIVADRIGFKE